MTNRPIQLLLLAISVISLSNCEEEEPVQRDYPRVRTLAVTNINQYGATFSAEVKNETGAPIVEHGFLWGFSEYLTFDYSEKVLMGEMEGDGVFSRDVTIAINSRLKYYMKAFIKTGDITVFGETVAFNSLGSLESTLLNQRLTK